MTCLGQISEQTFQDFEAVIVNDASTDNTAGICRILAEKHERVQYIELSQNRGTAGAINAGIESASGEFIAILSADDMFAENHLSVMYDAMVKNLHSVIYTDLIIFGDGKKIREYRLRDYDFEELLRQTPMSAAIMFPKAAWQEVGGYSEVMRWGREDWAFNIALGAAGYCGVHVKQPTYLYRHERHSRSYRTGSRFRHERGENKETDQLWQKFYESQLIALYPDLYGGKRPMGCCGGRGSRRGRRGSRSSTAVQELSMPGQDGMVLLEYVGGNSGKMTFWGPETRTRYVFGGSKKAGYVDKNDVSGMVGMRESQRPVFREVEQGVTPKPTPEMVKVTTPPIQPVAHDYDEQIAEIAAIGTEIGKQAKENLIAIRGVGPDLAERMIMAGFLRVSDIASVVPDELARKINTQPWRAAKIVEAACAIG
jgi:GT2 family glycosyltransferase/predicted flap endonuclease-1-like 5' DNA nuclease